MKKLLAKQKRLAESIANSLTNFKKVGKNNYTPAIIRARRKTLDETWARFQQGHDELCALIAEEERAAEPYFRDSVISQVEDHYNSAIDYMAERLEELEPPPPPSPSSAPASPSSQPQPFGMAPSLLQPIGLPVFDGDYQAWGSFKDRFSSLVIDNKALSDVSRMHYLAASLRGAAFDTIKHLPTRASSFPIACNELLARYDNPSRVLSELLENLLNLPSVHSEKASELHDLRSRFTTTVAALNNLGRGPATLWDDMIVHLVSKRLDAPTRKAWALQRSRSSTIPSSQNLRDFLINTANALEESSVSVRKVTTKPTVSRVHVSTTKSSQSETCPLCKSNHFLQACSKYMKASPSERKEIVLRFKRCINCLSHRHNIQHCQSRFSCRTCHKRHHSTLHVDRESVENLSALTVAPPQSNSGRSGEVTVLQATTYSQRRRPILLATAVVSVGTQYGRSVPVRALIDQGSESTFISEHLAQLIHAKKLPVSTAISAIGGVAAGKPRHAAHIVLTPRGQGHPSVETLALILPNLTSYSPRRHPHVLTLSHLANLAWADDDPTSSRRIEVIIGADLYAEIMLDGVKKGRAGEPIAQRSIFGWLISGPQEGDFGSARESSGQPPQAEALTSVKAHHCLTSPSLDDELRKFWEWEEVSTARVASPLEAQCEAHFRTSHSRDSTGRYVVRLPFTSDKPLAIGKSKPIAMKLAHRMERRLSSDPVLKQEYLAFMTEYEQLDHMRRAPHAPLYPSESIPVYIPHHPVVRDDSVTTRVRVVFNASCRTSNGTSLNDHLLTGPKLQKDLPSIILRWRQFKWVYSADITKMYRQIRVDERDWDFQRIVWRSNPETPFSEYQLVTVTYGTACAPYLALRVLQQLADDEGHLFPLAARILHSNTYVDDILFGADSIECITQARLQLISLLAKGGFSLQKWASNSFTLLHQVASENHGLSGDKILSEDETLKVLGLSWNPTTDQFRFYVRLSPPDPPTKRSVLSMIARLYDPSGWVTLVVVKAKLLIQSLWRAQIQWDDPLPYSLRQQWFLISSQLNCLHSLQIPRWTRQGSDSLSVELHGFADASNVAYAAVVYLRVRLVSGDFVITLLSSKSKVAPLKPVTVPRLELSAAVLLARLIVQLANTLEIPFQSVSCWSDSTVVLHWLSQHPSRWKVFVANRTAQIHSLLPAVKWRHVPSTQNPADCASRGLFASELVQHTLWWNGPPWLVKDESCWPETSCINPVEGDLEEKMITSLHSSTQNSVWDLANTYSSWPKLIRITGYVQRFIVRLRHPEARTQGNNALNPRVLTVDEVRAARNFWLRQLQSCLFSKQIHLLSQHKALAPKDRLLSLRPFLDSEKLLRVGGRLTNAPMTFATRHPILLAPHPLVTALVHHTHIRALHAGNQLTLSLLRRDYWVLRARNIVRRVISRCITCIRERAAVPVQQMGDLPGMRVTRSTRTFQHCGLDYAGPFLIRASAGRGIAVRKAYIALFICLATRAVHLEPVADYSTEAFLRAFSRFCSRRGLPSDIYSDNGTNFVGANRELTRAYRAALQDPSFLNSTAVEGISWHFAPPTAPHFGGIWEAGIRSAKLHLSKVMQDRSLTFEEFSTVLGRIEACLNSRPIAPLSDTLDDYDPLTPGHFLIGTALLAHPEPSVLHLNENRLSRWQLVRQLTERFWKLWQHDYINTLQQRAKWRCPKPNVCVGQLVLLRNHALPPGKWELGRVTHCHPGNDGLTRVVTVKTANSEYKRPIGKLCLLPVIDTDQDCKSFPPNISD